MRALFLHIKVFIFTCLCIGILQGQGIHFSQIDNIPLFINPALTAHDKDIDYRIGGNFREQESIANSKYTTYNIWSDVCIQPSILQNSWIGIGAILAKDKVNESLLDKTQFIFNASFHQPLHNDDVLSFGVTGHYEINKINTSDFVYEDQWNGLIYDRNIASQDVLLNKTQSYSLGLGLNYFKIINDGFNFNIGTSVLNINRPQQNFTNNIGANKTSLNTNKYSTPYRFHIYTNSIVRINDVLTNKSNAYIAMQGTAMEAVIGSYLKWNTYNGSPLALLMGLAYRWGASAIFMGGLEINNVQIMMSYDANINRSNSFVYFHNAIELSAIFNLNFINFERGAYSRNNRIRCKF